MDRRQFLRNGLIGAAGVGVLSTVEMTAAYAAEPGVGPYGSLEGINPDDNGIILSRRFYFPCHRYFRGSGFKYFSSVAYLS